MEADRNQAQKVHSKGVHDICHLQSNSRERAYNFQLNCGWHWI